MKKSSKLLLAILFILTGLFLVIYPQVTDSIYKNKVVSLKTAYEELINNEESNDNRLDELYNLLVNENQKLYDNHQKRFLVKQTYDIADINLADYGLTNNVFGFIEIPSINVTLPIYFGSNDDTMRLGATHLTGTSYPIGGTNTNSVIAAHRGFYKTEMFRHIDKINIGDKLYIKNFKETLEYTAVKTTIIKPNELTKLTIEEGSDMVTILSCHPFPSNTHRYVVYFKRV